MVGVTGFEPAASTSQMSRAPNCATPRFLFNFLVFCVEVGQTVVKLKFHAFLSFLKTPKIRINKGFSGLLLFYGILCLYRSQSRRPTNWATPRYEIINLKIKEAKFCFVRPLAVPDISSGADSHPLLCRPLRFVLLALSHTVSACNLTQSR